MTPELKQAFEKAKQIIYNKKESLVGILPVVHELEDGILIKFFANWQSSEVDEIKLKKISSLDNPDEKIFLGYVPKGIKVIARSNDYKECIICLDGHLIIDVEGDIREMTAFTKLCVDANKKYNGEALINSYFILIGCNSCHM